MLFCFIFIFFLLEDALKVEKEDRESPSTQQMNGSVDETVESNHKIEDEQDINGVQQQEATKSVSVEPDE